MTCEIDYQQFADAFLVALDATWWIPIIILLISLYAGFQIGNMYGSKYGSISNTSNSDHC